MMSTVILLVAIFLVPVVIIWGLGPNIVRIEAKIDRLQALIDDARRER
jgi:hypothetical protein